VANEDLVGQGPPMGSKPPALALALPVCLQMGAPACLAEDASSLSSKP